MKNLPLTYQSARLWRFFIPVLFHILYSYLIVCLQKKSKVRKDCYLSEKDRSNTSIFLFNKCINSKSRGLLHVLAIELL